MKLEILENILKRKISNLNKDFKFIMDSKQAKENTVFLAINKGNNYINEAISKGSFVIYDANKIENENTAFVNNTVEFMQDFARIYREKKKFLTIGITGSNGKTTVKDIISDVLCKKGLKCHKTLGNYNNHIGLPFTIMNAKEDDEILILEMGMSDFNEIDFLAKIAKPDYGIITNIGHSHLENLKTRLNIFKAKTELIKHCKKEVFVSQDDEYLSNEKNYTKEDFEKINLVKTKDFKTNLLGDFNRRNISLVDKLLKRLSYKDINYENLIITDGRFQIIKDEIDFINDSYNASPLSMEASIKTFSSIYNEAFKIMVLGDMLELGENEIMYHEELYKIIEESNFDCIFLYGNRMRYLYRRLRNFEYLRLKNDKKQKYFLFWYNDKNMIIEDIKKLETNKKKVVLLKASRGMKLEEIMEGII